MKSGRPVGSEIRQNLIEILYFLRESYGYELCKIYNQIFSKVSSRSVYYHLKKGVSLGEFKMKPKTKQGDYSWGESAEVIYYTLGEKAHPTLKKEIKKSLDSLKLPKKTK